MVTLFLKYLKCFKWTYRLIFIYTKKKKRGCFNNEVLSGVLSPKSSEYIPKNNIFSFFFLNLYIQYL